jgi:hypothetical protein
MLASEGTGDSGGSVLINSGASIYVEAKQAARTNVDDFYRTVVTAGSWNVNSPWAIYAEGDASHFGGNVNIGGAITSVASGGNPVGARLRVRGQAVTSGTNTTLLVEVNNSTTKAFEIDYNFTAAAARIAFFGGLNGTGGPVVRQTALTTALTTVTFTAPGTPDYAVAAGIQNTGWGFTTADEFRSIMSVIANLQTRVNELETKLKAYGLLT